MSSLILLPLKDTSNKINAFCYYYCKTRAAQSNTAAAAAVPLW